MIQVDREGQNCIIIHGGANQCLSRAMIDGTLSHFEAGDYLLMQNETNQGAEIIRAASEKGIHVILNPSPLSDALHSWPLEQVEWFILNEIEGAALSGKNTPAEMLDALVIRYPRGKFVLTLGAEGAYYADCQQRLFQPSVPAQAVDTTAAGDTFTGYFFHAILSGHPIAFALRRAAAAASIAVSRKGAAPSIPYPDEVEEKLQAL